MPGSDVGMAGPPASPAGPDHRPAASQAGPQGTRSQRWLARLSFVLAIAAIAFVAVFAELKSVAMLAVGLAAAAVSLAAAFFFLSRRGVWRWLSLAVFVLAPVTVIVVYALASLLWVAIISAAAWLLAGLAARAALAADQGDWRMPEYPVPLPARHPFLIMNMRSGGGKVGRFDLKRRAEDLGAEVFLITGPEPVDVAGLASEAVARGADLLGVAVGDGTQALVAGVAADHGIPADGRGITAPQALLVANNPYGSGDIAGLSRRARLDRGVVGVVGVRVASARQAVGLLRGTRAGGLDVLTARQVTVTANAAQIPVGVDGEAVSMPTPVRCTIRPGALRVRVPRYRPGVAPPGPALSWARLRQLAGWRRGESAAGGPPAGQEKRQGR